MGWFRRSSFPLAPNQQPRWHIQDGPMQGGVLTALCGYSYKFVTHEPMRRKDVKSKKLQCGKCVAKQAKLLQKPVG